MPVEIVSRLITHRSVASTHDIYTHTAVEDLRRELERAGVMDALEVA